MAGKIDPNVLHECMGRLRMSEWEGYAIENLDFEFEPGLVVLDVGCGSGEQMNHVMANNSCALGIDLNLSSLQNCRKQSLWVMQARAEQLPLATGSVDGAICKVVLPYTEERLAISEISRILKPGGKCYLVCHGAGYYLRYLLANRSWKVRFYGLRSLVNTWLWALTKLRLPGFLGDTVYQSRRRLKKSFRDSRLILVQDSPSKRFLGLPVFTAQVLYKSAPVDQEVSLIAIEPI